jgi:large subunit ribosomal protein L19
MSQELIRAVEKSQLKTDVPELSVGDTVDVHMRIVEGQKERIQIFNGVILKIQGQGISRSITVRRIVANEGVERTIPVNSPKVSKIEVKRHGHVRRAKLYYLRERVGKSRRLRDRQRGLGAAEAPETAPVNAEGAAPGSAGVEANVTGGQTPPKGKGKKAE